MHPLFIHMYTYSDSSDWRKLFHFALTSNLFVTDKWYPRQPEEMKSGEQVLQQSQSANQLWGFWCVCDKDLHTSGCITIFSILVHKKKNAKGKVVAVLNQVPHHEDVLGERMYEGVTKSFRTGRLERQMKMVQLSATRCSCIAILWVSLVSFASITLCVASQRVFIVVNVYSVIDSLRKLLDIPSYSSTHP
jgi:hypothetical protein